mgnify:CR=1 FL=1
MTPNKSQIKARIEELEVMLADAKFKRKTLCF